MKRTLLGIMLAAVVLSGWAVNKDMNEINREQVQPTDNTLNVTLDLVDFGDTVVVYISGNKELSFIGKDGKFEFQLQVDEVSNALLIQPKMLRGDMEEPRFYSIPLVGGESVRVWDTDKTRYDVDGTGFYADYHQADLFDENAAKEQ